MSERTLSLLQKIHRAAIVGLGISALAIVLCLCSRSGGKIDALCGAFVVIAAVCLIAEGFVQVMCDIFNLPVDPRDDTHEKRIVKKKLNEKLFMLAVLCAMEGGGIYMLTLGRGVGLIAVVCGCLLAIIVPLALGAAAAWRE